MAELNQSCRFEGCPESIARFSVFCESHHLEVLVSIGLASADPEGAKHQAVRRGIARFTQAHFLGKMTSEELLHNVLSYLIGRFDRGMRDFPPEIYDSFPRELEEAFRMELLSDPKKYVGAFVCDRNDPEECSEALAVVQEALVHLRGQFRTRPL